MFVRFVLRLVCLWAGFTFKIIQASNPCASIWTGEFFSCSDLLLALRHERHKLDLDKHIVKWKKSAEEDPTWWHILQRHLANSKSKHGENMSKHDCERPIWDKSFWLVPASQFRRKIFLERLQVQPLSQWLTFNRPFLVADFSLKKTTKNQKAKN